jgi:DNA primase
MARISDAEIDKLKTEVSLPRLLERQGYRPPKQGKDYVIPCPFHNSDDTYSLIITPQPKQFYCFGYMKRWTL